MIPQMKPGSTRSVDISIAYVTLTPGAYIGIFRCSTLCYNMSVSAHTYIPMYLYVEYIYIYIYMEKEKE